MLEKRKKFPEQFKQFLLDSYKHKYKIFLCVQALAAFILCMYMFVATGNFLLSKGGF